MESCRNGAHVYARGSQCLCLFLLLKTRPITVTVLRKTSTMPNCLLLEPGRDHPAVQSCRSWSGLRRGTGSAGTKKDTVVMAFASLLCVYTLLDPAKCDWLEIFIFSWPMRWDEQNLGFLFPLRHMMSNYWQKTRKKTCCSCKWLRLLYYSVAYERIWRVMVRWLMRDNKNTFLKQEHYFLAFFILKTGKLRICQHYRAYWQLLSTRVRLKPLWVRTTGFTNSPYSLIVRVPVRLDCYGYAATQTYYPYVRITRLRQQYHSKRTSLGTTNSYALMARVAPPFWHTFDLY
jgi:hypothetical protein